MQETLKGVPNHIYDNTRAYANKHEAGNVYIHKILFIDGTQAEVHTKKQKLEHFKLGEECTYHILKDLDCSEKDGSPIYKIKYGSPYTGSPAPAANLDSQVFLNIVDMNKENIIIREVCVKAAATLCGQSKQIHEWEGVANSMYEWVTGKVLEHKKDEPDWMEPEKKDDLPF